LKPYVTLKTYIQFKTYNAAFSSSEPPSQVRLGGDNLTLAEGEDLPIRRVIVHPEYNANTAYNDIALLELETAAKPELKLQSAG